MNRFEIRAPQEVLDWVNYGRNLLGMDPVEDICRGHRGSAFNCPIAKSLTEKSIKVRTLSTYNLCKVYIGSNIMIVSTPTYVKDFIWNFDKGRYPRYNIVL